MLEQESIRLVNVIHNTLLYVRVKQQYTIQTNETGMERVKQM